MPRGRPVVGGSVAAGLSARYACRIGDRPRPRGALFSLGVACWLVDDTHSRTGRGLVAAMLLYNLAVAGLLSDTRMRLGIAGVGFWPAVILHSALAVWCVACLFPKGGGKPSTRISSSPPWKDEHDTPALR